MAVSLDDLRRRKAVQASERWARVPRTVTEDPTLSNGAFRLLVFLVDHGDAEGESWWSRKKMATTWGLKSVRTIDNWLKELRSRRLVYVMYRTAPNGDPDTNLYHVNLGRVVQKSAPGVAQNFAPKEEPKRDASRLGGAPRHRSKNEERYDSDLDFKCRADELFLAKFGFYPKNDKQGKTAAGLVPLEPGSTGGGSAA
jgi:Helix-turn-helix domain